MNRRHLLHNNHWLWKGSSVPPTPGLLCLGEQGWYSLLQCIVSDDFSTFPHQSPHGREQSPESGARLPTQGRLSLS